MNTNKLKRISKLVEASVAKIIFSKGTATGFLAKFLIDNKDLHLFITCKHCMSEVSSNSLHNLEKFSIQFACNVGTIKILPLHISEVLVDSEELDLLIFELSNKFIHELLNSGAKFLKNAPIPVNGTPVFLFGYPAINNQEEDLPVLCMGKVIKVHENDVIEGKDIEVEIESHKGNSGSPYLDSAGRVYCIHKGSDQEGRGPRRATSSELIIRLIEKEGLIMHFNIVLRFLIFFNYTLIRYIILVICCKILLIFLIEFSSDFTMFL